MKLMKKIKSSAIKNIFQCGSIGRNDLYIKDFDYLISFDQLDEIKNIQNEII